MSTMKKRLVSIFTFLFLIATWVAWVFYTKRDFLGAECLTILLALMTTFIGFLSYRYQRKVTERSFLKEKSVASEAAQAKVKKNEMDMRTAEKSVNININNDNINNSTIHQPVTINEGLDESAALEFVEKAVKKEVEKIPKTFHAVEPPNNPNVGDIWLAPISTEQKSKKRSQSKK